MLSLLETLTREMQSSITRVFEQKTGHDYQIKENETKFGEVLATEEHRQRAEVLESVVQSGYAEQEMQMLYRHLVQLEETLVAERDNVIQLHERRAYLSSQIKDAKCNLVEERVSMDSLFLQMVHLSQRNSFLRAKLSYSRAQYHCQLTNARQMLGCRNAKVNQLRRALVKVRDLCHSIDGGYQTVLWEIGKQIQLTAELIAREHGLEWSHRPTVTTLTAAGLREWYQQIQHTTMWIQLHILSCQNDIQHSSQEECNVTDRSSSVFPPQYMANQMCLSLTPVKADTSSLHVAGNNSELSFDLELSLDMSNTVQLADKHKADLCSTTCSSLSQDLSRQRETPQDRYHMQHRFLTILDNLKVKLLQLTHSNVQGSNTAASIQ
ncbi:hypothetical protein L798_03594 [Zootermopsis nevadensis]|uniref:Uncharacterized protein n=2 Tax=Zootermopsis nevadensis TaxID=136037 RepID=A0A067RDV7_ZOONE|nr:hypothetical protein L798_03594 [Zootermopsis nevadensis]